MKIKSKKKYMGLLLFITLFVFGGFITNVTATPKSSQTLEMKMVLPWEPSGLDPHTAYEAAVQIVNYQVVEPLVKYDYTQDDFPLVQSLATDVIWNSNRTVVTFPLRDDVTFHDGTPFNAEAVVWNFNRIKNLCELGLSPFIYTIYVDAATYMDNGVTDISWANVSLPFPLINSTIASDEFEVELTLNIPYPIEPLLPAFAMISPTAHAEDLDVAFTMARNELVGTGPFKFTDWDPTEKRASFVRNDEYWRTPAAISNLYFDYYDNAEEAVSAIIAGDVDYIPNPPGNYIDTLKDTANIVVEEGPSMINYNFAPMNSRNLTTKMRQALVYGINMSYYKEEFMGGIAGERCGIVPVNAEYYNESLAVPDFDLAHARQILIDEGLAGSLTSSSTDEDWENVAKNDPIKDLIYTYFFSEDFGGHQDVGLWLNSSVNKLGMSITFNPVGDGEIWGYFWSNEIRATTDLMQTTGWGFETRDALMQIPWIFLSNAGYNYAGYQNSEFDDLYQEAITAQTVDEKQEIMNQIQKLVNIDDPPFLWTYPPRSYAVTRSGWEGARVGFFYGAIECYYMNQGDWEAPDEKDLGKVINIPGFEINILAIVAFLSISVITLSTLRKRN